MLKALVAVVVLSSAFQLRAVSAQTTPPASTTAPVATETPHPSTPSAATSVTSTVPTAVRTPFADTPTPALPEEGGPAGGVLGGHLYIDENGSGARDKGDGTTGGTVFVRGLDLVDGGHAYLVAVASDTTGYWELRAVPDGSYQVYWQPPISVDQLDRAVPPAQSITLNPNQTFLAVAETVDVKGAGRILDIDFGIPPQSPVAGSNGTTPRLPNTGDPGGVQGSAPFVLLAVSLTASLLLAGGIAWSRRRAS